MERIELHPRGNGKCHIDINGVGEVADFEMGVIGISPPTGVAEFPRVAGYYVKLVGPEGQQWMGRSSASVVSAMRAADDEMGLEGARLLCAGVHNGFYETGLSEGTGYGYISGYRDAVHIFERPLLASRVKLHPS